MTKNLGTLVLIFFLLFTLINCSDDQQSRRRMSPQERATQLQKELDLTDEQTKQFEKIFIESQKKMAEDRELYRGDREQMREMMRQNREETDELIEEILTAEQLVKYQEYRAEREEEIRERRGSRRD